MSDLKPQGPTPRDLARDLKILDRQFRQLVENTVNNTSRIVARIDDHLDHIDTALEASDEDRRALHQELAELKALLQQVVAALPGAERCLTCPADPTTTTTRPEGPSG